jgi:hypothetical protein
VSCQESVVDEKGNSVQLFNEDFFEGPKINTSVGRIRSEAAENFPLYATGIECVPGSIGSVEWSCSRLKRGPCSTKLTVSESRVVAHGPRIARK